MWKRAEALRVLLAKLDIKSAKLRHLEHIHPWLKFISDKVINK